ncbi:polysaccharide biosynthesis C-terminal domain-containing protein [bacterium]|nr:polysaccharide biosynthesis C-terminal domain-containing protein [bacterium]
MSFWRSFIRLPSNLFFNRWLQSQQQSILSAATVITAANLLVSVAGLLRDRFMLSLFAGDEALLKAYDAFRVAFQVPDLLYQLLIVGALSASFVPIFTLLKKKNPKQSFRLVNICMNYLLVFFLVVASLIAIFAPQITAWRIGEAYNQEQIQIVINLTRLMMLGQLFFAVSSFFSGMLQSYQRFIIPALSPLFYNAGIVLGAWSLFPVLGIYGAGVGVIFGAFLHMAIQYPAVKQLRWRYRWEWDFDFPGVKKLFAMMPARALTIGMNEIQSFGLSYFITSVAGFGYTLFLLARTLVNLPIRFVGVPIGQAALPILSNLSYDEDVSRFKKIVLQSLNQIAYLACPAAVLLIILRIPIVRLVFSTHNFAWNLTVMVARMVAWMAISIPVQAMFHLLVRAFHALRDTMTPFLISIFTTCVFFIGCALAIKLPDNQLYGITIAISLSMFIETGLYLLLLNRKLGHLLNLNFIVTQSKIYLISIIMAVSLYIPFKLLDELVFNTSRVIPLLMLTGITSVVGLSVYILLSKLFRIEELKILTRIFENFRHRPPKQVILALPPTEIISDASENND